MASIKRQRPEEGEASAPAPVFPTPRFPRPQPHPAMTGRSFESLPSEVGIAQYQAPQIGSQPFSVSQPSLPRAQSAAAHHHPHAHLLLTPSFQSAQAQASTQPAPQQQFQRLKLKFEDALSYLHQVELQFGNQPQVYNDFLDIMKEFKSQRHPDIIMGSNTFLPPGYKIEVIPNEPIQVITMSSVLSKQQLPLQQLQTSSAPASQPTQPVQQVSASGGTGSVGVATGGGVSMAQMGYNALSVAATQAILHPQPAQQLIEFNHAINYVNKIKNRFQARPETYKAFLEILHTYQKEQRTWRDVININN
ncbi:paired amphipathic helix protein Sin3a-like isoform X2 [Oscarella lobularis]|uniref:paired amphipathic helix protein Sin3a-like isoform X2 n=1 Tax=Oscarella lobularis TaxID=121494 RepID=UPI003313D697